MAWVFAHSPATSTDRLVLLSLANHANDVGQSWPSVATIAREANISERATQRALANLARSGAIEVIRRGAPDERIPKDRRPNLYRVLKRGDGLGTPRGDAGDGTGVTLVAERGDGLGTQTIIEPSEEPLAASPSAKGKRDLLFESLAASVGWSIEKLTKNERGRLNDATKQLREIGATPAQVTTFRSKWRQTHPNARLTPQAICGNWSAFINPHSGPTLARCCECERPLGESHNDESCANRARMLGKTG